MPADLGDVRFVQEIGQEASAESWRCAPPAALADTHSAFEYAWGSGMLFGFRAGLETVAKMLEDPAFDGARREVIAAAVRDLVGAIEANYVRKVSDG